MKKIVLEVLDRTRCPFRSESKWSENSSFCEHPLRKDCQEKQPWKQTYTWTVADQIRHYKGLGFPKMSRRARERQYVQTVCDECILSQEYDKYYMLKDEVVTEGRPLREVLSSVGVDWSKIDQQPALELW